MGKSVMEYGYDLFDKEEPLTFELRLVFPTGGMGFSFKDAVKSLQKKAKTMLEPPEKFPVPDKFNWYVKRQTKKHIVVPKMQMERDGAKILTMDLKKAEYDTREKDNWKLIVYINGTYEKVEQ